VYEYDQSGCKDHDLRIDIQALTETILLMAENYIKTLDNI
jgi:hypothetical protein